MQKGLIRKWLVFSVIVLFIGVSISSVTSKDISISIIDNSPPDAPTITGPSNGLPGQEYTFTFYSDDPDGDDIRFHIGWGDGTSNITPFVASGTNADASHIWNAKGYWIIRVKAEDIHGLEGFETTFKIYIGRSKGISNENPVTSPMNDDVEIISFFGGSCESVNTIGLFFNEPIDIYTGDSGLDIIGLKYPTLGEFDFIFQLVRPKHVTASRFIGFVYEIQPDYLYNVRGIALGDIEWS